VIKVLRRSVESALRPGIRMMNRIAAQGTALAAAQPGGLAYRALDERGLQS
jgi:hypothetical protein